VRVCLLRESISLTIQSIRVVHEGEVVYWVHVFIILILGHVVPPIMHLVVSPIQMQAVRLKVAPPRRTYVPAKS
jgi:hypothetical protein